MNLEDSSVAHCTGSEATEQYRPLSWILMLNLHSAREALDRLAAAVRTRQGSPDTMTEVAAVYWAWPVDGDRGAIDRSVHIVCVTILRECLLAKMLSSDFQNSTYASDVIYLTICPLFVVGIYSPCTTSAAEITCCEVEPAATIWWTTSARRWWHRRAVENWCSWHKAEGTGWLINEY